jgi:hypothetical protein
MALSTVEAELELAPNTQSAFFANFDGEFSGHDQFYCGEGRFK